MGERIGRSYGVVQSSQGGRYEVISRSAASDRSQSGSPYGPNAQPLLMASKAFLAISCVALTLAYHVVPPTSDWLAAELSIAVTVRLGAPLNAALTLAYMPLHLAEPFEASAIFQILVRSIISPPIGSGAPILLPPRAGSLK